MYDVVYLDQSKQERVLAAGLARQAAVDLACDEARRRKVGRMFLAGSKPRAQLVVIVESQPQARQAA